MKSPVKQTITKLDDTFTPTIIKTGSRSPSRMEEYWKSSGFDKIYKGFRKSTVKSTILSRIKIEEVGSYFKLQGYAFGGWVTQGDRYNYLAATAVCLEDLNRVLKFRNNLGLSHHIGITFGARGIGARGGGVLPRAHYEPFTGVINLTRYKSLNKGEEPKSHSYRFLRTGGVGALCHELGHAIDFYGGAYLDLDPNLFSLSGGKKPYIARKEYKAQNNELRNLLEDVLAAACLNVKGNDFSTYYKRIKNNKLESDSYKEYLLSRTELVARLFEQYVAYKLKEMGIVNTLLTQKNYKLKFYPTSKEFERIVKPFDEFFFKFRKRLNDSSSTRLKPKSKKKTTPKAAPKPRISTKPKTKPTPKEKPTTTNKPKSTTKSKSEATESDLMYSNEDEGIKWLKGEVEKLKIYIPEIKERIERYKRDISRSYAPNEVKIPRTAALINLPTQEKLLKLREQNLRDLQKRILELSEARRETKPTTNTKNKRATKSQVTPTSKTITVKIPVTLQTIENHLWGKNLGKATVLSKMPDKDFLLVWKYVLAGNAMLRKGLNPSDLFNSNKHILPQVANNGIVENVQKEFKKREWERKYTLSVELKENSSTKPKNRSATKKANKTVQYEGFKVVHNVETERLQIIFEEKPSEAIRTILKKDRRFWWIDKIKAWQRKLDSKSLIVLEQVLKEIKSSKAKVKEIVTTKPRTNSRTTPGTTLPESKKHALPPHPVDRVVLAKAIKRIASLEKEAISAWSNSSHFPTETAKREIAISIHDLKKEVEILVNAPRRTNINQYIDIFVRRTIDLVASRRNVISWGITGRGGSYSASKAKKSNDRHDKKFEDFSNWKKMRLEKAQAERSTDIKGGTSDTISKLQAKMASLQKKQEYRKLTNKFLRSKEAKGKNTEAIYKYLGRQGVPNDVLKEIEETQDKGVYKIPAYNLTNNNANINNIKKRIITEEKRQEHYKYGNKTQQYEGFRVVENVENNVLQLFFDQKPSEEVRAILKKNGGLRWAPKNKAWQRQLTKNAVVSLEGILGNIIL